MPIAGWLTIAASTALLLVTAFVWRRALPIAATTGLWALAGLGLGLGGVLVLDDPDASAWVLAPLTMAVGSAVHMRALFAGNGPLRT